MITPCCWGCHHKCDPHQTCVQSCVLHMCIVKHPATAQATRGGCCTTWAWACGPFWLSRRLGCCAPPAAAASAACQRSVTHDDIPLIYRMTNH